MDKQDRKWVNPRSKSPHALGARRLWAAFGELEALARRLAAGNTAADIEEQVCKIRDKCWTNAHRTWARHASLYLNNKRADPDELRILGNVVEYYERRLREFLDAESARGAE